MKSEQETEILKNLADKIRLHMKAQKISNRQLAFEIGTSEGDIRRVLKGEENPGYLKLHSIATALNISVADLLS